jgi:hypothetical protein
MPDLQTIETALGQALAVVPGIPSIAWPNRGAEPSRPFVLFDHVPTVWENVTVDASEVRASGYFDASVCIAQGGFSTAANTLAQAIISAFPVGRRLGGVCVVAATPLQGYFDEVGWRQPVRIEYRSEQ